MRVVKKIAIGVSVIVAIFIIVAILFEIHLTNCTKDTFMQAVANSDRKFIVEEIDNYRSTNHRLPASLSELGFEQTLTSYVRNHNTFNLVRLGSSYVLEFWDSKGCEWQYVSDDRKWYNGRKWEFEPPINADTIFAIYGISNFEQDYNILSQIDSISFNHKRICPILDMTDEVPDSIAHIRYLYADNNPRCEGWVAFFDDPEDDFSHQYGEWKYYDVKGNCYRKFWNYKEKGKLIYEADR